MGKKLPDHIDGLIKYLSEPEEKADEDLILKYFRKVYPDTFGRQKEAKRSDGYVPSHFVLELKGKSSDWLSGLFQGIAYQRDLDFSLVVVAAKGFLSIWKVDDIDESIREEILLSKLAPNTIGKRIATKHKSRKSEFLRKAIWNFRSELLKGLFAGNTGSILKEIQSFKNALDKQKRVRRKVTTKNFVSTLEEMIPFFDQDTPIKAVRAFYSMVFGWTPESHLEISQRINTQATLSGEVIENLIPGKRAKFKSFVDNHYVHLEYGQNVDDFFAKYDKALDAVDKNFRKKHGIFFTDLDLSKFVMWLVRNKLGDIGENYLVIDPACGSGNLVTNWRSPLRLRHKVVSEIEPELLYTVEKRMKGDAWHEGKFTVVPKVKENIGLNFLDKSAGEYIEILKKYLIEKGHDPDKPIAFLCNPPYRSDDDQTADAIKYKVHASILKLTGNDASAERYCCFLAQMKLFCKAAKDGEFPGDSLLLLFTGTAWLTKRPIYENIRHEICSVFEDVSGMIVNSKEFFDVPGRFPIAFTIWRYRGTEANLNPSRPIPLTDLTWLKKADLTAIDWNNENEIKVAYEKITADNRSTKAFFGVHRNNIREWSNQTMLDFKRSRRKSEKNTVPVGGLPKGDPRHYNKKAYGESDGSFIGFMDNLTLCRVKKSEFGVPWFRLNNQFMDCRKTRCFSGPPDHIGYRANNLSTAKTLFTWFALGRTFASNGYPMWVNTGELWPIKSPKRLENKLIKIAFAIGFAENECVEAKFPANNPITGAKELSVSNPMTPLSKDSFWSKHMASLIGKGNIESEDKLVRSVEKIFDIWKTLFKKVPELYVDYKRPYFIGEAILTKNAGLIQIKDYAKEMDSVPLLKAWGEIQSNLKFVKNEFYELLMQKDGFNYFGRSAACDTKTVKEFRPKTAFEKTLHYRLALASIIIKKMADDKNFGRVKLAKVFYLADQNLKTDLKTEYYKQAAGPLDQRALYNVKIGIEAMADRHGYFSRSERRAGNIKVVRYSPEKNLNNMVMEAKALYGKDYKGILRIIECLKPLNTEKSEIVATLYACWNDLLIARKKPDDQDIIDEFRFKWHQKKKRFPINKLKKALEWMRTNKLVPEGRGRKTKIMVQETEYELF